MPADNRYTRSLEGEHAALTSLDLEYKDNAGAIQTFTLTDFTTSFENNGFWNTATGVTRIVPTGAAQVMVAIALESSKRDITICVQDGAFLSTDPKRWLQFRNVKFNGYPADRLGNATIRAIHSTLKVLRMDVDAQLEAIAGLMTPTTTVTPILSNMAVNKTLPTSYWPTKSGVTRTGSVSRPPNTVTDFYMADANYDGELELPLSSVPGRVLSVRNEATYTFTLRRLNTNLEANVSIPTSRSIHFVADATGKWNWILAAFATR
jgi:hypothetical protein